MNSALSTDLLNSGATATASAASSTCNSTQQATYGISTGAAAGIGVGVGVPLAVALGAVTFMLMREKRRPRYAETASQQEHSCNQSPKTNTTSQWGKPEGQRAPFEEVTGHRLPHELADTQSRPELDR